MVNMIALIVDEMKERRKKIEQNGEDDLFFQAWIQLLEQIDYLE